MSAYPGQDPSSQPPWTGAPPSGTGPVPGTPPPGAGAGAPTREQLAGFWIRFVAALLDGIVVGVVAAVLTAPFGLSPFSFTASFEAGSSSGSTSAGDPGGNLAGSVIQTLIGGAYTVYLIGTPAGQTLGMRATGIRVADASTGGRISYPRSLGRYAMGIVSAIPFALGYLWMLWDPRRQTWHDKVAQSLVVRTRSFPPPAPFGKPPS